MICIFKIQSLRHYYIWKTKQTQAALCSNKFVARDTRSWYLHSGHTIWSGIFYRIKKIRFAWCSNSLCSVNICMNIQKSVLVNKINSTLSSKDRGLHFIWLIITSNHHMQWYLAKIQAIKYNNLTEPMCHLKEVRKKFQNMQIQDCFHKICVTDYIQYL